MMINISEIQFTIGNILKRNFILPMMQSKFVLNCSNLFRTVLFGFEIHA